MDSKNENAMSMLGRAAASIYDDQMKHRRSQAADRLLDEVEKLVNACEIEEFRASRKELSNTAVKITLVHKGQMLVTYRSDGTFDFVHLSIGATRWEEAGGIKFRFDPRGFFVTDQPDPTIVPTPGQPFPTRRPIDMLVEKIAALAGKITGVNTTGVSVEAY
jgi:hypothetical protein